MGRGDVRIGRQGERLELLSLSPCGTLQLRMWVLIPPGVITQGSFDLLI